MNKRSRKEPFFDSDSVAGFVSGGCVVGGCIVLRDRQGSRGLGRVRTVPPGTARSLRWVGVLLPGEESNTWLAEVGSCLAEATDAGERRRYVRSYRWAAPQLIWVSWAEHLKASLRRELS